MKTYCVGILGSGALFKDACLKDLCDEQEFRKHYKIADERMKELRRRSK